MAAGHGRAVASSRHARCVQQQVGPDAGTAALDVNWTRARADADVASQWHKLRRSWLFIVVINTLDF